MDTFRILFTMRADIVEDMDCEMKTFGKGSVFVRLMDKLREKENEKSKWEMKRDIP